MESPNFKSPDDVIEQVLNNRHVTLRLLDWELEEVPERVQEIENLEFLDLRYNRINALPEWLKLEPDFDSDDYVWGRVLLKGNPIELPPKPAINLDELPSEKIDPPFGIPELLVEEVPNYAWNNLDNLISICKFENDCLDVFHKAIHEINNSGNAKEIKVDVLWKCGAKLVVSDCCVEIRVLDEMKTIQIRTVGENKRKLLREVLDLLCKSCDFKKEKPVSMGFPGCCQEQDLCFDPSPFCFDFWNLRNYRQKKRTEIDCHKATSKVQVHELLDIPRFTRNVYISYSAEDEDFRRELRAFLAPVRDELEIWDCSDLLGGDNKEETPRHKLLGSDIVIYIISSDFLNNRQLQNLEANSEIQKEFNKSILAIPVIAKPCLWEAVDCWKKLKPAHETPVSTWVDKAEAWTQISKNILKAVQNWQPKK